MTLRDTRTGKTFHAEFRSNRYAMTILVVTETGECIPLADHPYTVVVEATPKERRILRNGAKGSGRGTGARP